MMDLLNQLPVSHVVLVAGLLLILVGLWGMLTQSHLIRIIIGFSLLDTGIHMVMVAIGYIKNGTAPIIDSAVPAEQAAELVVDPVPSALVLTAIVIGLAVTGVMLAFAVRIQRSKQTLIIDELTDSKG